MRKAKTRKVIRVFNAEGASEAAPWDEVEAAITTPSELGEIAVWLGCELAWADLEAIARRHDLHHLQLGERGAAEAGVGILARTPLRRPRFRVGSRAGRGVRMRPLLSGRTLRKKWTAGHAPPGRNPVLRAAYLAAVAAVGGFVGLDANQLPAWMRSRFERRYASLPGEVLGLLVPPGVRVGRVRRVDIGSDHWALDVEVWV